MLFCGLDLFAPVPDETTHCRFRNALMKGDAHDDLLAARPDSHIDAPQDRTEAEVPDDLPDDPPDDSVPTRKHDGAGTARSVFQVTR